MNGRPRTTSYVKLPLQCRPDSPTSLEDSQSESGSDSSSPETTDTEHSTGPFPNDDDVTIARSKAVMAEQVATPPLSPAKLPQFDEQLDQHVIEDDSQDDMFGAEMTEPLPYERSKTSAHFEAATTGPNPAVVQSPKFYGWPTYVPGAPFAPILKTGFPYAARPRGSRRVNLLRLHERFPIVLPPETEAKLSMEMVDLFEVIMKARRHHQHQSFGAFIPTQSIALSIRLHNRVFFPQRKVIFARRN